MNIRIEDGFEDVIGKALSGLGMTVAALADQARVEVAQVEALLNGVINDVAIRAVAPALGLSGACLLDLAHQRWRPAVALPEWGALFNTPFPVPGYQEMTVNSFLFWSGSEAVAVDTGARVDALCAEISQRGLQLRSLLITHTHRDHIAVLDTIRAAYPEITVYCPEGEPLPNAVSLQEGARLRCGALQIESRETSGHSPGALSYVVTGGATTVAFVGDSLFCLSMGKAAHAGGAYARALENNRTKLLSLPGSTVLCPGHGPMTSVGEERARNPFFA
jgi:glyoxylase-like metal-dependent hydrolase (beta-lactamase superfamily II)